MFPLRDDIRSRSFPFVTWALILINSLVFIVELSLRPAGLELFISIFGLVPAGLHLENPLLLFKDMSGLLQLASSMFIHSGWFHFLNNMWVLGVFGKSVEDHLGSRGFLSAYLLGGLAANLVHALVNPHSSVPVIGASGAIAGVLGGYFLFFPQARVLTLVPIFIFPWFFHVRAYVYLGFWFLSQLYSGLFSLRVASGASPGGVAWWAHIGGFLFGVVIARVYDSWKLDVIE